MLQNHQKIFVNKKKNNNFAFSQILTLIVASQTNRFCELPKVVMVTCCYIWDPTSLKLPE